MCPSSYGYPVPKPEVPIVEENIVLNYWTEESLELPVLEESSGFPKRKTSPLPMGGEDEMNLAMEESHTEVVSTSYVDDGSDANAPDMKEPMLVCTIIEGRHLKDTAVKDHEAPFTACCGIYNDKYRDSGYFKTDFVSGAPNHFWNQTFVFQVDPENPVIEIFVLGRETASVSLLGYAVHTFTSEQIDSILRCRLGGSTEPFLEECWVNLEGGEGIGVIHLRISTSHSMDRDQTQVLASSAIDMYDYVVTGDLSTWLGFKGYLDRIEERQIDRWLDLQKVYPILFTEPHSFQYFSDNIDLLRFVLWGFPSAEAGLRMKPKLLARDPANGFELHTFVSYARYLEGIQLYKIKVEYGTARWSIWKEYADFITLSETLELGEILGIIEKKFDVKERRSLVAMTNPADILKNLEKRRRALDEFLKQALRVSESGTSGNKYSQDINNFFGMRSFRQVDLNSLSNPRGSLWYAFSGAYELASDSTIQYDQIVGVKSLEDWINLGGTEDGYKLAERAKRDIALDIRRTDSSLNDTEAGQLFDILGAFALMHPKIGYCQAMNFITLCLLRVCRSEKHAFFLLCSIVRNMLPYYYINSMKGVRADMLCIYNLFKNYLPSILGHFEELGLPLELFLTEWLLCILSNDFPKRSVFLLWDWFFLEGPEVVFYILLAFFTKIEKEILRCTEMEECIILIKLEAAAMYDAIELVDLALKAKSRIGILELRNLRETSLDAINMSRVEQQKKKRRPSRLSKLFKIISPTSSQIHDLHEAILRIYQKDQEMQQAKASKQHSSANPFVDNFQSFFNPLQKTSSMSGVSSDNNIPLAVPEFFGLSKRSIPELSMVSDPTAQSFEVTTAEGETRCYIECSVFEKAFMRVFRWSQSSSDMSIEAIEAMDLKGKGGVGYDDSDDDGPSPPESPIQTPYASDENGKGNGKKRSGVIRSALKRVLEVFTVEKQDMIDFQELLCVLVMLSNNVSTEFRLKLYFEILRDKVKKDVIPKSNVLFLLGVAADVTRREMFRNALDSLITYTDWIGSEALRYEDFCELVASEPRVKKALYNDAQQSAESHLNELGTQASSCT